MTLPNISNEIAAIGLGLDCSGAVYLGLSLLKSPMYAASLLFADSNYRDKPAGRQVSTLPVRELAESMLQARVGLFLLLAGFVGQLVAVVLPSAGLRWGLPFLLSAAAIEVSRRIGGRWITRMRGSLEESIWMTAQITHVVDREAMRRRERSHPEWRELRLVAWLRRRFQPESYR